MSSFSHLKPGRLYVCSKSTYGGYVNDIHNTDSGLNKPTFSKNKIYLLLKTETENESISYKHHYFLNDFGNVVSMLFSIEKHGTIPQHYILNPQHYILNYFNEY